MDKEAGNNTTFQTDKKGPQQVSGKNEQQTKQRTEPLKEDDVNSIDKEEGDMHNGELERGLNKG